MIQNKIILIGNGPSALKKEMGNIINEFPLVCRFNNFKTKNYEKYVGEKTNIWVTCLGFEIIQKRANLYNQIYFPLEQKRYLEWCQLISNADYFPAKIYKIASEINKGKKFYPSSGLLATIFFLEKDYDVTLYGFDFFQGEIHHYSDTQTRGTNHSPEMELLAFKQLIEEKRVTLL